MPSSTGITSLEWLILSLALFAIIAFLVLSRRAESRRIERMFPRDRIVATSFGVSYFGLSSEPGGPARSSGALVLLKDGIYYHARFGRRELHIPAAQMRGIEIVQFHKGKPLYQKAISIRFVTADEAELNAVFRIPMPDRWLQTVRATILKRPISVHDLTEEPSDS